MPSLGIIEKNILINVEFTVEEIIVINIMILFINFIRAVINYERKI